MAEGIRAPNLPLRTDLSEFLGIQTDGTQKSVGRFTRASVLGNIEAAVNSFVVGGGVIFRTLSEALGALNYPANQMAWVIQDTTPANNGVYQKSGASGSGSWSRLGDLPYGFYRAVNEGAGAANAIQATNGYPMANKDSLIVVNITDTTTASPVTLSLNGETPLTIKTASGNDPAPGGLIAGMVIAGYIDGTEFRLLSDQASAAIQAAAEAAAATAVAAKDAALGAMTAINPPIFDTETTALAYHPTVAPTYLRVQGEAAVGDQGVAGRLYKNNGTTTGDFVLTLDDGTTDVGFDLIVDKVLQIEGPAPDTGSAVDTEMATAITAVATAGVPLYLFAGTYKFTEEVDFSNVDSIILGGDVVFDFTGATDDTKFPNGALVTINGGSLTSVGALGGDYTMAARAITIATPALSPETGDILCIYDSTDGGYNAARTYYRKGEFIRVGRYSAGLVVIAGSLLDGYDDATTTVYKHPAKRISIAGGKIKIKEPIGSDFNNFDTVEVTRVADSDLSAFVPTNPAHSGILFNQCVGIYGVGYHVEQNRLVGSDNYGVVFANCQDCRIDGKFSAVKHAVTCGGLAEVGCVPNSNIVVTGTFRNIGPSVAGSGYAAVNHHGNTRHSYYGGLIDGSVVMGGNFNGLLPGYTIRARGDSFGIAILLGEMVGHDFNFSHGTIIADGNPLDNGNATIDIGANGNGANANTKLGGTIRLDGTTIIAPGSARPFVYQNQGYVGSGKNMISLRGVVLQESSASPIIVVATASGYNVNYFDRRGFINFPGATFSEAGAATVLTDP